MFVWQRILLGVNVKGSYVLTQRKHNFRISPKWLQYKHLAPLTQGYARCMQGCNFASLKVRSGSQAGPGVLLAQEEERNGRAAERTRGKLETAGFAAPAALGKVHRNNGADSAAGCAGLKAAGSSCPGTQPNPYPSLSRGGSSRPVFPRFVANTNGVCTTAIAVFSSAV